jgi:hypothetical protein
MAGKSCEDAATENARTNLLMRNGIHTLVESAIAAHPAKLASELFD